MPSAAHSLLHSIFPHPGDSIMFLAAEAKSKKIARDSPKAETFKLEQIDPRMSQSNSKNQ
jgi:hypothetical protein